MTKYLISKIPAPAWVTITGLSIVLIVYFSFMWFVVFPFIENDWFGVA